MEKEAKKMQNEYMFYLREQGDQEMKKRTTVLEFFFGKRTKTTKDN